MKLVVNLGKIKELRKASKLSLNDMSKQLGFKSPNGYFYLETGKTKISAEMLANIALILNVPIDDLFMEVESKP
ncbi:transcriptional regulator with XRE-family HTH domain [Scopulibacillus daqui]|uniref:Transcriptional regulator with XRE-family HTH domain n=1 Tax=Scopulibacillus daqui TaxID=1469162 RepID=A0ABS2Q2J3_9BACL|nr:transcriptional regulator with XRE-family HTH domain [Scopulibacillus daqui]